MPSFFPFAERMSDVSGSVIRELLKLTAKPGMISFAGGNPGRFALPNEVLADMSKELLLSRGKELLQYGATEGYRPFVEALLPYLQDEFGYIARENGILPVSGSTQAMDLLCKVFMNPGDTVLVENPTFIGNLQCLKLYKANLVTVESDENGIIPERLEEAIRRYRPKMLYTIPTFQNPTGITMSLERRKEVARLAGEYRMLVAEDDPYRSLRYSGDSLPSIASFDTDGWVVLMGSFSKVISPGLRVGFMAAAPDIIRKCAVCKQSTDVCTPPLTQALVTDFLLEGRLKPHVQSISAEYAKHLNAMLDALGGTPRIKRFTRPDGGLFVFVYLLDGMNAEALFKKAVERGVAFVPGAPFYAARPQTNTFRLNFSNADIPTIQKGMDILKNCIKEL